MLRQKTKLQIPAEKIYLYPVKRYALLISPPVGMLQKISVGAQIFNNLFFLLGLRK